jgi:hypothetical protein
VRRGRPSRTAAWVAVLRGLAQHADERISGDPVAEALVPPAYATTDGARRAAASSVA